MRRAPCMTPSLSEAVRDRPGVDARLLPISSPSTVSPGPPSGDGRSKDFKRQALTEGHCRNPRLGGRKPFVGFVLAGQAETPGIAGKWAITPKSDPASIGALHRVYGGESNLPSPSSVERCRSKENPHTTPSTLPPSQKVWENRRAVASGVTALQKCPGPSIASLPPSHSDAPRGISDLPAHLAPHPAIPSPLMRPLHNRIFRLRSGIHPLWVGHSARPELSRRVSRAEWVGVPALPTQNYAKVSRWERVRACPEPPPRE